MVLEFHSQLRLRQVAALGAFALVTVQSADLARAQVALAPSSPIALEWSAPAMCPTSDDAHREIAKLLGPPAPSADKAPRSARVVITHSPPASWSAWIQTSAGQRALQADSCATLVDAVALVLALSIDPDAAARAQLLAPPGVASAGAAPTSPGTAVAVQPVPIRIPVPLGVPSDRQSDARTAAARATLLVGARARVDIGSLPSPGYGIAATAGFAWRRFRGEGSMTYFPSQEGVSPGNNDAGGDMDLLVFALDGCGAPFVRDSLRLDVCAGAEVGTMNARGFGVSRPGSAVSTWIAAKPGGALDWTPWAAPLGIRVELGAAIPFSRPTFVLDHVGDVHRASAIAARGAVGIDLRF